MAIETEATYLNRVCELVRVEEFALEQITWDSGWNMYLGLIPKEHRHLVKVGAHFVLETRALSRITGLAFVNDLMGHTPIEPGACVCGWEGYKYARHAGDVLSMHADAAETNPTLAARWLFHKSDQELTIEHEELLERIEQQHEKMWETHHEEWAGRESRLSEPLRKRLERFRANGGHAFEANGWGYELVASELAMMYAASNGQESNEISAFDQREGASGNQHDFAKMLGRALREGRDDLVIDARAALAVLTGDNDYSKAGA